MRSTTRPKSAAAAAGRAAAGCAAALPELSELSELPTPTAPTAPSARPAVPAPVPETDASPAATVTVYPDGPLVVRGDVEIRDLHGVVVEKAHTVALCRCGRSALKPLCDGSHNRGALGPRPA